MKPEVLSKLSQKEKVLFPGLDKKEKNRTFISAVFSSLLDQVLQPDVSAAEDRSMMT